MFTKHLRGRPELATYQLIVTDFNENFKEAVSQFVCSRSLMGFPGLCAYLSSSGKGRVRNTTTARSILLLTFPTEDSGQIP